MTVNLHHIALTVTDIDASVAWYSDLFDFVELVREEHNGGGGGYGVLIGRPDWSIGIDLSYHPTNAGEVADPARTGLDHVGFTVSDRAELEEWEAKMTDKGIKHSPISDHDWGSSLNFRDPDDMQLQFVAFA